MLPPVPKKIICKSDIVAPSLYRYILLGFIG
jgi:hypothetical protein